MAKIMYRLGGFCVVDGKPIPAERQKRGSICCSEECQLEREKAKRKLVDERYCRHCRHPSTLEERAAYKRFRYFEKHKPELLYPNGKPEPDEGER
jgi:hypothetical protein